MEKLAKCCKLCDKNELVVVSMSPVFICLGGKTRIHPQIANLWNNPLSRDGGIIQVKGDKLNGQLSVEALMGLTFIVGDEEDDRGNQIKCLTILMRTPGQKIILKK